MLLLQQIRTPEEALYLKPLLLSCTNTARRGCFAAPPTRLLPLHTFDHNDLKFKVNTRKHTNTPANTYFIKDSILLCPQRLTSFHWSAGECGRCKWKTNTHTHTETQKQARIYELKNLRPPYCTTQHPPLLLRPYPPSSLPLEDSCLFRDLPIPLRGRNSPPPCPPPPTPTPTPTPAKPNASPSPSSSSSPGRPPSPGCARARWAEHVFSRPELLRDESSRMVPWVWVLDRPAGTPSPSNACVCRSRWCWHSGHSACLGGGIKGCCRGGGGIQACCLTWHGPASFGFSQRAREQHIE